MGSNQNRNFCMIECLESPWIISGARTQGSKRLLKGDFHGRLHRNAQSPKFGRKLRIENYAMRFAGARARVMRFNQFRCLSMNEIANTPGPPSPRRAEPRLCGARTRAGSPCLGKARANGRCRLHGGMSTGPRTGEGRRRISEAQRRRWAKVREAKCRGADDQQPRRSGSGAPQSQEARGKYSGRQRPPEPETIIRRGNECEFFAGCRAEFPRGTEP